MAEPTETPTALAASEDPTPVAFEQSAEQTQDTPLEDAPLEEATTTDPTVAALDADETTTLDPAETDTQAEESSVLPGSDSITVAPVSASQFTTTSMVTTTGTEQSLKKRRGMSKIDAANVYMYGHVEEPWHRRDIRPSTDDVPFRPNRAQTMRHSCITKRTKDIERVKELPKRVENLPSDDDSDTPTPIVARKVPMHVYDTPKVPIKETKSSKFRYLFNRKPAGVKVYFKPANADPKQKPPFVVIAHPSMLDH